MSAMMLLQIGLLENVCKLDVDTGICLLSVCEKGVRKPHRTSPVYFFGTFFFYSINACLVLMSVKFLVVGRELQTRSGLTDR